MTSSSRSTSVTSSNRLLFVISVMALVTAGVAFSIRSDVLPDLQRVFFDPIDPEHSAGMTASVASIAFLGFAFMIPIGGIICDYLGMGLLLGLSSVFFILGSLATIFAGPVTSALHCSVYWYLWFSMLILGFGWGLVEAIINPLIATLFPDHKTQKLNTLHAWWPGGLIIGGLIGYFLGELAVGWQVKVAMILVPAAIYLAMLLVVRFPATERVASEVTTRDMWRECLRPMFWIWFACMWLTAACELAPGQWVQFALTRTVHMQGILLLVYVSGIMFLMRHFAGPLAHRFSPVGLLWLSALLAGFGLTALSFAKSPVTGILAATVWGTGVCYMWPTMLGVTAERFPKGGALLLAFMGTAGNLSSYFVLGYLGKVYDQYKVSTAASLNWPNFSNLEAAAKAHQPGAENALNQSLSMATHYSFLYVAALPIVLLIVFGLIWLRDRAQGGYRPEKIGRSTIGDEIGDGTGAATLIQPQTP
ncbi:MAG TPA: MFS transporter [Armatimonadota bacterium]|nr:MFS transporter [Armatimonadota bacterium]